MPPSLTNSKTPRRPNLCRHKASSLGYVTWQGKEHYFKDSNGKGIPWPADRERAPEAILLAYDSFLAAIYSGREPEVTAPSRITIAEVCLEFLKDAEETKTRHAWLCYRAVVRHLVRHAGPLAAEDLGPLRFMAFQKYLEKTPIVTKRREGGKYRPVNGNWIRQGGVEVITERPRTRSGVNKVLKRVREIWKWAVKVELIHPSCLSGIKTVSAVRAPKLKDLDLEESDELSDPELLPVDDKTVRETLKFLPRIVAAMVRLQRITAMRPGELCRIRMREIDRSDPDCWWYHPRKHKNQWRGRGRSIPLGRKCQEILREFLRADPKKPLFSPADRIAELREEMRARRRTRVQPSQLDRSKAQPKRKPGLAYTTGSYGRAIKAACKKAGVTPWSPNQLRKAAADEILNSVDLDHARALLGHSHPAVTSRSYAVRDRAKARVAQERIAGI